MNEMIDDEVILGRTWREWNNAAAQGTVRDADNPIFTFSTTSTGLLRKIVAGELNAVRLARIELQKRGFDA